MTAGCLVAGCTGGGEPAPSPPVETSAEASVTETPEPEPTTTGPPKPERPAAMERDDAEGAAAAAEYFLELYDDVLTTGDTTEWDSMSWTETCEFCTNVSADAAEIASSGDDYAGSAIALSNINVGELDTLIGGYPVTAEFKQDALVRTDSAGTIVEKSGPSDGRLQIDMLHDGAGWRVLSLTVED
ncbi:DUF6318 family protein [Cellulosimicrobium cellulans]|uniref:DUF6318 family protein n=1 Tax=Cellulosimicrobium sp. SJTW-1 TaxID=3078082 RepID=UPI0039EC8E6F